GACGAEAGVDGAGLGWLWDDALVQRGYAVLRGLPAVVAAPVVVFNALTDGLYGLVDPRAGVREGRGRAASCAVSPARRARWPARCFLASPRSSR
ncbi:hypothetical protein NX905_29380, partial [Burkholderia thailandensis]|nr:hypothetical protein [Burkholderia thailandensis]